MNVVTVEPKGEKAAILIMDDGTKVWTPEKEKAHDLVGKPIPADWTVRQGDFGPQAFPPRDKKSGGGGGGYRSTKEGFHEEQDFMNRRTALMQAVAVHGVNNELDDWESRAGDMYTWLRTGGAGQDPATERQAGNDNTPAPSPPSSGKSTKGQAPLTHGDAVAGACPSCGSVASSFNKPDGNPLPLGFVRCTDCNLTRTETG